MPIHTAFAEEAEAAAIGVTVVSVDCTENVELCQSARVQAFPTMVRACISVYVCAYVRHHACVDVCATVWVNGQAHTCLTAATAHESRQDYASKQ